MKSLGNILKKRLLIAGAVASTVALVGGRAYADSAADIESYYALGSYVSYDNTADSDSEPNGYPIISVIASQPGTFGNHYFTGWSALAADGTGSLDLFLTSATLTSLEASASASLTAGMGLNLSGVYSPYSGIAEMTFASKTNPTNYLQVVSTGNTPPPASVFTIAQLEAGTHNGPGVLTNNAITGTYIEIQDVTISGSTGSFMSTFPLETQGNVASESYSISDGTSTIEMFDWTTSYSVCAALGGSAVPTGPVDIYGFYDSYNEFVPLAIVPEPSTLTLAGIGLIGGLMAIRRRRRS